VDVEGAATTRSDLPDPRRNRGRRFLVLDDGGDKNVIVESTGLDFSKIDGLGVDGEKNASILARGTFAERPDPGTEGRYFYAVDVKTLYIDDGTSWNVVLKGTLPAGASLPPPQEEGQLALQTQTEATGAKVWAFTAPTQRVFSSPAVASGTVYVGCDDNTLYAIDAATGAEVWACTAPTSVIRSSPTVAGGMVYVGSVDTTLYAVDPATGAEVWAFTVPSGGVPSSPTVVDGTVYVGSYGSTLYAVDPATGTEVWTFTAPSESVISSPTVAGGTVYVGSDDSTLYAIDAATRRAQLYISDAYGWSRLSLTEKKASPSISGTPGEVQRLPERDVSTIVKSGDGAQTTFSLPHGLPVAPQTVMVQPESADAAGDFHVSSKTASAVEITYNSAPADGTDNLQLSLTVER